VIVPLLLQAGSGDVCLEVGAVDHQLLRNTCIGGQGGKDTLGDTHAAPADEVVAERLVRPVPARRILPPHPIADNVYDPADYPPVIDARLAA
jgi:hypothetical protein